MCVCAFVCAISGDTVKARPLDWRDTNMVRHKLVDQDVGKRVLIRACELDTIIISSHSPDRTPTER